MQVIKTWISDMGIVRTKKQIYYKLTIRISFREGERVGAVLGQKEPQNRNRIDHQNSIRSLPNDSAHSMTIRYSERTNYTKQ